MAMIKEYLKILWSTVYFKITKLVLLRVTTWPEIFFKLIPN